MRWPQWQPAAGEAVPAEWRLRTQLAQATVGAVQGARIGTKAVNATEAGEALAHAVLETDTL